jgi:hypothetical protein
VGSNHEAKIPETFCVHGINSFSVASIYNIHQQLQGPMTAVKNDIAFSTRNNNDCLSRVQNVRGIKMYSQNDEDGALLQTLRCMAWEATDQRNTLNLTLNQALKSIRVSLEIYMAGPHIYSTDLLKILIFRFTRIFSLHLISFLSFKNTKLVSIWTCWERTPREEKKKQQKREAKILHPSFFIIHYSPSWTRDATVDRNVQFSVLYTL